MATLKVLRVQTPKGQKRYNCSPTDTLLSIKQKVHGDTGIPLSEIELALRDEKSVTASIPLADSNHKTLDECGLKNGDLLMVVASAELMHKPEESKEDKGKTIIDKNGNLVRIDAPPPVSDVIEDPIDQAISKEDGWIYRKEGLRSSTKRMEDYIAPWDIEKHEPWKSMDLGHIPFHSWSRQSQSGLTEEINIKKPNTGEKNWQALTQTIKIQRQPYRHVDSVTFEHQSIANAFVQEYVKTGYQQYAFLLGTYQRNPDIPLGITCLVSAIFTPSSWNPPKEAEVDRAKRLGEKFGLELVGWTWTALGLKQNEGRTQGNHLKINEMYHMAKHQGEHPNKCSRSDTGKYGSKFVSVVALDNEEGHPHFRSFQLSNQAATLINESIIKISKKKASKFLLTGSNEKYLIPELIYFQTTGEEGARITTEKRVGRYLDEDIHPFFVVTQPVTFPVNPNPKFTSFTFPTVSYAYEKEGGAKWSAVDSKLNLASGPRTNEYWAKLNDFHFLLWVDNQVSEQGDEILQKKWDEIILPVFINNKDATSATELIKFVRELKAKAVATAPPVQKPPPQTYVPPVATPVHQASQGPVDDMGVNLAFKKQLMDMVRSFYRNFSYHH